MHVLILPSWYFPFGSQQIAGRMFHHLAGGLRENNLDARVLYSNYSTKGSITKNEKQAIEAGVPTWRYSQIFPPKVNRFFLTWWINKCVEDILKYIAREGKPDLIHAHSYFAAAVASALQKKYEIPFIYTERLSGFMTDSIPNLHKFLLEDVFECATSITGVSPGMAKCLRKFTDRTIEVVPNFYNEDIFCIEPGVEKYDLFTWVSIGEPAHIKGLDNLFHAFAELKARTHDRQMQLILIDHIPEKKKLIKLAKSLQIETDIVWKGLMRQSGLAQVLKRSHVLVSASRVETFGKAIVEAQACGLPVVATKTEGARYIMASKDQGELAETGNAESLVRAMQKVMMSYSSYTPDKIKGHVQERFSKEVVINQWIILYNSLLI